MTYRVHLDSFSGALGDLRPSQQRSDDAVLDVLSRDGRFTVFDVTPTLGRTLDRLKAAGRIEYPEPQPAYPWCRASLRSPAQRGDQT